MYFMTAYHPFLFSPPLPLFPSRAYVICLSSWFAQSHEPLALHLATYFQNSMHCTTTRTVFLPDVLLCSFSFLLFYISRSAFCFRHTLCYIIYLFAFILNVYVLSLRKAVLCLVTGKLDAFSPLGPLGPRETARYNRHFSVRQTCGLCSFRTNKRKIQPS